jgi:hypothetical protein
MIQDCRTEKTKAWSKITTDRFIPTTQHVYAAVVSPELLMPVKLTMHEQLSWEEK